MNDLARAAGFSLRGRPRDLTLDLASLRQGRAVAARMVGIFASRVAHRFSGGGANGPRTLRGCSMNREHARDFE